MEKQFLVAKDKNEQLGKRVMRAAAWTMAARWGVRSIGLISTIILARLLAPQDFGLVALALSTWTIFETFLELGLESYLIRHRDAGREEYDTVWSLTLVRGFILCGVVLMVAPKVAEFLNEPNLTQLFYAISGVIIISSLKNVGIVDFQKELRFDKEFKLLVATKMISFLATVTAALILRSYWALMFGVYARHLTLLFLSYQMHAFRPRLDFSRWRSIFDFSVWITLTSILGSFATRIDNIILRRFVEIESVGFYTVGKEIASLPTSELIRPIGRALFPGMAALGSNIRNLSRAHLESTSVLLSFAMPAGVGVAIVAPDLVRVMLGEQWETTGTILSPIALALTAQMLSTNLRPIILVLGRTKLLFARNLVLVSYKPAFLIIGASSGGLEGAVLGFCFAGLLQSLIDTFLLRYLLKVTFTQLIIAIYRPVIATAVMVVACLFAQQQLLSAEDFGSAFIRLGVIVGTGIASFAFALFGQWLLLGRPSGPEARIIDILLSIKRKIELFLGIA